MAERVLSFSQLYPSIETRVWLHVEPVINPLFVNKNKTPLWDRGNTARQMNIGGYNKRGPNQYHKWIVDRDVRNLH